jgi:hypothetical protein
MLLMVSFEDAALVPELSDWLETAAPWNGPSVPPNSTGVGFLRSLTNAEWGGWKLPECHVWGGALNHADLDAVVKRVAEMPWDRPGAVQLLIQDQEQTYFRLWMLRDGRMRQLAPDPPPDGSEL